MVRSMQNELMYNLHSIDHRWKNYIIYWRQMTSIPNNNYSNNNNYVNELELNKMLMDLYDPAWYNDEERLKRSKNIRMKYLWEAFCTYYEKVNMNTTTNTKKIFYISVYEVVVFLKQLTNIRLYINKEYEKSFDAIAFHEFYIQYNLDVQMILIRQIGWCYVIRGWQAKKTNPCFISSHHHIRMYVRNNKYILYDHQFNTFLPFPFTDAHLLQLRKNHEEGKTGPDHAIVDYNTNCVAFVGHMDNLIIKYLHNIHYFIILPILY